MRSLGRALRILGLIEGGPTGVARIREAITVLENSPARLEHAYALADLGAALRRTNQRAEAREHLQRAVELAQRCGASLLAERAHEELIATGARPRRLVRSGIDDLTPSERRIAAMADAALVALGTSSGEFYEDAPAVMLIAMTFAMTVPLVAWMRYRGHPWRPSVEMAASMVVPMVALLALLWTGLVTDSATLMAVLHAVMLPSMLIAMLMRRHEYSGHHSHSLHEPAV